jgi:hypothetical protein
MYKGKYLALRITTAFFGLIEAPQVQPVEAIKASMRHCFAKPGLRQKQPEMLRKQQQQLSQHSLVEVPELVPRCRHIL